MSSKVVGLIRTGGVILLFIIGVILLLGAMDTEVDPDTNEAVGDVSSVIYAVNFSLWLVRACVIFIAGFTVWAIIQNPKRFIPAAIGVGVFAIIAFVGYSMASSEPIVDLEIANNTAKNAKMGGAGIKTTFLLVIIAVALILVGSVMSIMRYFSK